jgi:hypothetical protein
MMAKAIIISADSLSSLAKGVQKYFSKQYSLVDMWSERSWFRYTYYARMQLTPQPQPVPAPRLEFSIGPVVQRRMVK